MSRHNDLPPGKILNNYSRQFNKFSWIGINALGEKISGTINSENKFMVKNHLLNNDITILSIKKSPAEFSFYTTKKLSSKLRLDFTEQLQIILQAGIPLADSLELLKNTAQNKMIQDISCALKEKIITGVNFSNALGEFPQYFDRTYCQMIAAGEHSGQLEAVLTQLIENQENRIQLKNKIIKALFYPLSVLCIALIIAVGLLIFVIPQFSAIYNNFGAQLPTMTRSLISISHYLSREGIYVLLAIASFVFVFKKMLWKNARLKNGIDYLLFKFPLSRTLMMTNQVARWSQLLAMTLSSGVPLIDALHIANHAISQPILQMQMQQMRESVIAGKSLHAALSHCRYFPVRAKSMIGIAENADALSSMMKKIGIIYHQQLNDTLDHLSKLLEPVIMIMVASLVSGLIVAMYLPIFRMGSVV